MNYRSGFDLDPFFLFTEPESNKCVARSAPDAQNEYQIINCKMFPGHRRDGKRTSDLNIVIPCERTPDVIFTWMWECLIQERALETFEAAGLSGFTTRPASAKLRHTGESIAVREFLVTGWGGLAGEASGIKEVERCQYCGHLSYSGLEEPREIINPANWDGSDFFMIWPLPRFRFVTRRVVDLCRAKGISGVAFEQNYPSWSGGSGFSPGRLSYYMPSERAHLLGDDLKIY